MVTRAVSTSTTVRLMSASWFVPGEPPEGNFRASFTSVLVAAVSSQLITFMCILRGHVL